ncbi:NPCBM/NEW2 domain-containing protein [Allobaculum mucilyticum]|uniref:NPCBM/NEW2 domain-containing protein n=1 Tax=Allobaculum mucilyticum TaxID=2834459 RepID=UPI001E62E908|nr:NPCBM/NEW2 domain-containing protein [Allobaculum mucilyticum]UNT95814.1 NPCBM/NEW2 domain-containing protein [Allobaculum mucilyticum]
MKSFRKAASLLLAAAMASSTFAAQSAPLFANEPAARSAEDVQTDAVIDVTDFGADPSGYKDSVPAVKEAIAEAKKLTDQGQSVTISFPKGEYNLYPDKAEKKLLYLSNTTGANTGNAQRIIGICIEDMNNVVVDGNGSRFVYHNRMTPYAAISSENVIFKNFSIDYAAPTCLEMTSIAVDRDAKTVTYHIPESLNYSIEGTSIKWSSDTSPYTGDAYWEKTNGYSYKQYFNSVTGDAARGDNGAMSGISSIEDLGNHQIKITYSSLPAAATLGSVWETRDTLRDQTAGTLAYSKNVTLQNIDENYVHGFGIIVQMCEDITLDGVVFDTPDNSGRATSSSADDINISGVKGKITIKNSRFHNPHDDPINVHGTFLKVTNIDGNKVTVEYQHNETSGFPNYFVGDKIEFSQKGSMAPVANSTRTVTAVSSPDGKGGWIGENTGSLGRIVLTLDEPAPAEVTANNYLTENITYTPDVDIHDNVFDASPTRGILCTTRGKVDIHNNMFNRMNMAGIYISCDGQSWYESGRATDVTIRNNTFINGNAQDIYIEPTNPSVSKDKPVHHNITIEGNTFYTEGNKVLDAKSTEGITFKNNTILRAQPFSSISFTTPADTMNVGVTMAPSAVMNMNRYSSRLFRFNGSSNIKFEGNTYDPQLLPGIEFANGTSAADVTSTDQTSASLSQVLPEDAKAYYLSSDESVIATDAAGNLIAKGAGEATITGYVISGTRKFMMGTKTITVNPDAAESNVKIVVSSDKTELNAGETAKLTAAVTGAEQGAQVTWSVSDAFTGQPTEAATIAQDGTLTAGSAGTIVRVTASAAGASASAYVQIKGAAEYSLSSDLDVLHAAETDSNLDQVVYSKDSIRIPLLPTGLYQQQVAAHTLGSAIPEGIDSTNFTVTVKASTPDGNGNWGYSGLYLFKDQDNYVSVEKKSRADSSNQSERMAMVREVSQHAAETWNGGTEGAGENMNTAADVWYRLVKSGNAVEGYYSKDGETFNKIGNVDGAFLGTEFQIAIAAGSNAVSPVPNATFSELTFTSGDTQKTVALTQEASLSALTSAACALNGSTLSVTAEGKADGAELAVIWEKADSADGEWTPADSLNGISPAVGKSLAGKSIRSKVYQKKGNLLSEPVTTNVIQIEADNTVTIDNAASSVKAGESADFTASGTDKNAKIAWSVSDAFTGQATAAATIDSTTGKLTGVSGGLVLVTATAGNASASTLVRIEETSYGLADGVTVAHKAAGDSAGSGIMISNGSLGLAHWHQGLYQDQTPAHTVVFDMPEGVNATDFTATVKAVAPDGSGNWGASGLYLFRDADNYVSVERKSRANASNSDEKMALVREESQRANEYWESGQPSHAHTDTIWYRLTRKDNKITAFYSTDGSEFKEINSTPDNMNASYLGEEMTLALATCTSNNGTGHPITTFSDLSVTSNGQTYNIDLTKELTLAAPTNAALVKDEATQTLTASAQSATADAVVSYVWQSAESEDGPWTVETGMHGDSAQYDQKLNGKFVRVLAYSTKNGAVSAAAESNAIEITGASEIENPAAVKDSSETRLAKAQYKIAGADTFTDLDLNQRYWFYAATEEQDTVSYDFAAMDPDATVTVNRNNKPVAAKADDVKLYAGFNLFEVFVTAKDGTIREYRLQIFRSGNGDTSLKTLKVNGTAVDIPENGKVRVDMTAQATNAVIEAEATSSRSTIEYYMDGKKLDNPAIALKDGPNKVIVVCHSEALQMPSYTEVNVYKPASADCSLSKVDFGSNVELSEDFEDAVESYTGSHYGLLIPFAFTASNPESTIEVSKGDTLIKSGTGSVTWNTNGSSDASTTLKVKVTSPDKSATKTYTFELTPADGVYASDLPWTKAESGWENHPPKRDASVEGNTLTLFDGTQNVTFAKGIGTHSAASGDVDIDIDLSGKQQFDHFYSKVGLDKEATSASPKVKFTVLADGVELASVDNQTREMKYGEIDVDIPAGTQTLTLRVTNKASDNSNSHADWAEAKLSKKAETPLHLTAEIDPSGAGTGTLSVPDGDLAEGQWVTVKAEAAEDSRFVHWVKADGTELSTDAEYTYQISAETASIKALFERTDGKLGAPTGLKAEAFRQGGVLGAEISWNAVDQANGYTITLTDPKENEYPMPGTETSFRTSLAQKGTWTVSVVAKGSEDDGSLDSTPAQIEIKVIGVAFDTQIDGEDRTETLYISGSSIDEPTAPTRDGFTFGGWYKEAGCTNAFNFASEKPAADTVLYAKWTKDEEPEPELNWYLLDQAIEKGNQINGKLASYKDAGKKAFTDTLASAKALKTAKTVSQDQIDAMAKDLAFKELALRLEPNKDLLNILK